MNWKAAADADLTPLNALSINTLRRLANNNNLSVRDANGVLLSKSNLVALLIANGIK